MICKYCERPIRKKLTKEPDALNPKAKAHNYCQHLTDFVVPSQKNKPLYVRGLKLARMRYNENRGQYVR